MHTYGERCCGRVSLPQPGFTAGTVCEGNPTSFTDPACLQGAETLDTWAWTFGDAGVSNDRHPEHVYNMAGTFMVTLNVSDPHCERCRQEEVRRAIRA